LKIGPEAFSRLLRDDIQHYDTNVRDHLTRIHQLALLVFTVAGIAGTLLYGYHQYVVLLAIPPAGCVALLIGASLTGEMFALAAHKTFLEETLHDVLIHHLTPALRSKVIIPWEAAGGQLRRRSLAYSAIQVLYFLLALFAGAISIAVAWVKLNNYWWLAAVCAGISIPFYVVAIAAYIQVLKTYDATTKRLEEVRVRSLQIR
jgi:hypothetical protein